MARTKNSEILRAEEPEDIVAADRPAVERSAVRRAAAGQPAAEQPAAAERAAEDAEVRYSAESLRRHAMKLFQVNPEIVDGALYGADGDAFTIKEAQSRIEAYLKREVK